jgi:hypothetical protein
LIADDQRIPQVVTHVAAHHQPVCFFTLYLSMRC